MRAVLELEVFEYHCQAWQQHLMWWDGLLGRLVRIRVQYVHTSQTDLYYKLHVELGPLNQTPCFLHTISTPETILNSELE
jgi:hypothetical protein